MKSVTIIVLCFTIYLTELISLSVRLATSCMIQTQIELSQQDKRIPKRMPTHQFQIVLKKIVWST